MAIFRRVPVPIGQPGQTVWKSIRDKLVAADSVEVVKKTLPGNRTQFVLHVWFGIRQDGSNENDADDGADY